MGGGRRIGLKSFSGLIGQKSNRCKKLSVINFQHIDCEMPQLDRKLSSKDQQYLWDKSQAIKSGDFQNYLPKRVPSLILHAILKGKKAKGG